MAKTSLTTGRTQQKKRTRAALIEAAAAIAREGQVPSVPETAARAEISRATAYRYFPTQDSLEVEAANAILAENRSDQAIEQPPAGPDDCVKAVEKLERAAAETFWRDEAQIRLVMRSRMDLWLAMKRERNITLRRPRRAMPEIDAVLAPLKSRLSAADYDALSGALAVITGPEAIIALLDGAGIREPQKVDAIRRFALRAILSAGLEAADL